MNRKHCFKCGKLKSIEDFYKHSKMPDGTVNKCKECNKKDVSERYLLRKKEDPGFIKKDRKRGRDKYRRLYAFTNKANPEACAKWIKKYPEKKQALLKSYDLFPPSKGLEKHHWSYNDIHFRDVLWLTKKQHMKAHRFIYYDQSIKLYRRYDNFEPLKTKRTHSKFINHCIKNEED